jgi:hypothetical protein
MIRHLKVSRYLGDNATVPTTPDPVQAILQKLTADMKQEAIEQAAIQTGVEIGLEVSLAFIPIVGWIADIVIAAYAALTYLISAHYKTLCQQAIASFQNEMTLAGAACQQAVTAAQSAAFQQEEQAGIQMAISGQVTASTPVSGMGNFFSVMMKVIHDFTQQINPVTRFNHLVFQKIADVAEKCPVPVIRSMGAELARNDTKVYGDIVRAQNAVAAVVDQGTGEQGYAKVQEAIVKARAVGKAQLAAQQAAFIANINSDAYRAALRIQIAQMVLKNPSVAALVAQGQSSGYTVNTSYKAPSATLSVIPAAAAAAGVLLFAGLGSK